MPLSTNRELLTRAKKGGYAVSAFNINNMEILQAIVSAGEAEKSPVILAVSEGAIREVFATKPEEFDPRKILGPGREAIRLTVQSKMRLFGSSGKVA